VFYTTATEQSQLTLGKRYTPHLALLVLAGLNKHSMCRLCSRIPNLVFYSGNLGYSEHFWD
jgi:hypothetical protein